MVFAELEIISAALYSDDPVVQNPRHMEGVCAHFFAIHPSCSGLLQHSIFISVSMEGLRPADSIFSANYQDCLSTVTEILLIPPKQSSFCDKELWFSSHPKSLSFHSAKEKKNSLHLPCLCINAEGRCLQLLGTSMLQIVILSKNSINIFNHAIKDHIRMDMHQGKRIKLRWQSWICHRLPFDCLTFLP